MKPPPFEFQEHLRRCLASLEKSIAWEEDFMDFVTQSYAITQAQSDGFGAIIIAIIPWLITLVAGFVLIVTAMFFRNSNLAGTLGIVLLGIGAFTLVRRDTIMGLSIVVIGLALLRVVLSISIRSAINRQLAHWDAIHTETSAPEITIHDLSFFVGKLGQTTTALRPTGTGEFDGVRLSIVSAAGHINADNPVVIERVKDDQLVVKRDKRK